MDEVLKEIQASIARIEKQLSSELRTVATVEEAQNLFARLTKMVEQGETIELIIRKA